MKAINIVFIILVLPTNVIISQLEINAGGSFSNLASEQASGNTNTSINGGLKYDFKLNPFEPYSPWRISPELFIRQAGSNK